MLGGKGDPNIVDSFLKHCSQTSNDEIKRNMAILLFQYGSSFQGDLIKSWEYYINSYFYQPIPEIYFNLANTLFLCSNANGCSNTTPVHCLKDVSKLAANILNNFTGQVDELITALIKQGKEVADPLSLFNLFSLEARIKLSKKSPINPDVPDDVPDDLLNDLLNLRNFLQDNAIPLKDVLHVQWLDLRLKVELARQLRPNAKEMLHFAKEGVDIIKSPNVNESSFPSLNAGRFYLRSICFLTECAV